MDIEKFDTYIISVPIWIIYTYIIIIIIYVLIEREEKLGEEEEKKKGIWPQARDTLCASQLVVCVCVCVCGCCGVGSRCGTRRSLPYYTSAENGNQ